MSFRNLMNRTVEVQSKSVASDAVGGATETTATRYASMPCRIQPVSGALRVLYARERTECTHNMFFPAAYSAVAETDLVVDGSNTYEVRFVAEPDLSGHHLEAELREVRGGV